MLLFKNNVHKIENMNDSTLALSTGTLSFIAANTTVWLLNFESENKKYHKIIGIIAVVLFLSIYVIYNPSQQLPLLQGIFLTVLAIFPVIGNQIVTNITNKKPIGIIRYISIGAISFAIFSGAFYALFYDSTQQQFLGAIVFIFSSATLFFVTKVNESNIFERLLAFEFNKVSLGFNRDYRENLLIRFRNSLNTYIERKK